MGLLAKNERTLSEEHFILDIGYLHPTDKEYAQTGLKEGWLVYVHGMRDYRGVICHTYRYIVKGNV